jgi:soluble P-type ATPase
MLEITIPNHPDLRLQHLVLDYNGTLAIDGQLIEGVPARLAALADLLRLHIITADTFGTVRAALGDLPCELAILPTDRPQDAAKRDYVAQLGAESVVAIGNGRNDRLMLQAAALGVAVVQAEGAALDALLAAAVVAPDILSALDLLTHPLRLAATLRL